MNSLLSVLIIICVPLLSFSQNINDTLFAKQVLKTYPLNYLPYCGEINLGYEFVIGPKSSVEIIGAWNYKDWVVTPSGFSYYRKPGLNQIVPPGIAMGSEYPKLYPSVGGSIRFNYRYYLQSHKPMPLGTYISAQLMYKLTHFSNIYSSHEYGGDSMNITKHAMTLKFLFGAQYQVFKKISFSYFLGAGMRYQPEKATRFYYRVDNIDTGETTESEDNTTITVHYFTPTVHLGVSVGYFF